MSTHFDLVEHLLGEQQDLSAVERFSRWHEESAEPVAASRYRKLMPASSYMIQLFQLFVLQYINWGLVLSY